MIKSTPILTYQAEVNPFEEVDYLQEAKERETEQFKNKDVFNRYLQLLLEDQIELQQVIKQVMQERNLDNAKGVQLDIIGEILGQPRVLFDSAIIRYFGFQGATGASPYKSVSDTERVYGPWKSVDDPLLGVRKLTDPEYKRILKLKILKNTSGATITAFSDGVRLLFGIDSLDYQEDFPPEYSEGSASITFNIGRNFNDPEKSVFPGLDEITLAERYLNRPLGVGIYYQDPITLYADFKVQRYREFVYGSDGLTDLTFSDIFTLERNYTDTYYDSSGNLQTAPINTPRFTHNPTTLEPLGLLIESPNEVLKHTWGLEASSSQGTLRVQLNHYNTSSKEAALLLEGNDFKLLLYRENTYWSLRVEYDTDSYTMIIPEHTSDSVIATMSYSSTEVYFNIQDEHRRTTIDIPYNGANIRGFDMRIGGDFSANSGEIFNHFNGTVQSLMYLRPYIGIEGTLVEDGIAITTEDYEKIITEFGETLTT